MLSVLRKLHTKQHAPSLIERGPRMLCAIFSYQSKTRGENMMDTPSWAESHEAACRRNVCSSCSFSLSCMHERVAPEGMCLMLNINYFSRASHARSPKCCTCCLHERQACTRGCIIEDRGIEKTCLPSSVARISCCRLLNFVRGVPSSFRALEPPP
jgi:hypothetical protein